MKRTRKEEKKKERENKKEKNEKNWKHGSWERKGKFFLTLFFSLFLSGQACIARWLMTRAGLKPTQNLAFRRQATLLSSSLSLFLPSLLFSSLFHISLPTLSLSSTFLQRMNVKGPRFSLTQSSADLSLDSRRLRSDCNFHRRLVSLVTSCHSLPSIQTRKVSIYRRKWTRKKKWRKNFYLE